MHAVFISNAGIVSAIGNNIGEHLLSFRNHRSGVGTAAYLATRHREELPVAEVKLSNADLARLTGLKPYLSRTILLSHFAASQALEGIPPEILTASRMGFISASTVGGMDRTESFFEDFLHDHQAGELRDVRHHDCGKPTDFVCDKLGLSGMVTTISTACSSSANAIMLGARMIRSGRLDAVLAGGVDALTRFTLNGFNSLMIVDKKQCRPLDQTREGLNLGEGAAYVLLVSAAVAVKYDLDIWCRVTGYSNTNDAHHQTALSENGEGPYLAMKGALEMSGLQPADISYVNMHGTGTQNNDLAEGKAMERIFHPAYPPLSSTKSFTGHTLGASGAIEAVFSAAAIREQCIFPNFSFQEQIHGLHIRPVTQFTEIANVRHVLTNSFGFGGNCTSLVLSQA
jgi:3-oxoacyl-[acyl-carrier-protein] synthase-1